MEQKRLLYKFNFILTLLPFLFWGCKSTDLNNVNSNSNNEKITQQFPSENQETDQDITREIQTLQENSELIETGEKITKNVSEITLLFAGDIMAHSENYNISTYEKIWRDVKNDIEIADLAFGNIEAPIDTTKPAASYPSFNMTKKYVQAAINGGFDVFSLCNNHTNDQGQSGILETIKTTQNLTEENKQNGKDVYFAGIKESKESPFTYQLIEKNGWKILFLPITELLNRPENSQFINFVKPDDNSRKTFIEYCKKLRLENPCDLFILSIHTGEPEYTRNVTERQRNFYMDLLNAGADVVWANHAHIIKNREFVYNNETGSQKLIMYANGNTISGQRRKPDFNSKYPDFERDNTGDGLFYYLTFEKDDKNPDAYPKIKRANHIFITTYINTANEFVLKKLDNKFVEYLYDVPRNNWAEYIKKRIKIDNETTKDYITWQ